MKGSLERRLEALETSWFGSPKVAAYLRALGTMSEEELSHEFKMMESDDPADSHLGRLNIDDQILALRELIRDKDRSVSAENMLDGTD